MIPLQKFNLYYFIITFYLTYFYLFTQTTKTPKQNITKFSDIKNPYK